MTEKEDVYFQFYQTRYNGWCAERIDLDEATLIAKNEDNMDQFVCLSDIELEWDTLYHVESQILFDNDFKFEPWKITKTNVTIGPEGLIINERK
jgi:hypothetical protein